MGEANRKTFKSEFIVKKIINNHEVAFFTPPHNEPDFPWVDVWDLAYALSEDTALSGRMLSHTRNFSENGGRAYSTARNGDRITTIVCHAMAQGLCGVIDKMNAKMDASNDEDGPSHTEYCSAASDVMRNDFDMGPIENVFKAYKNVGGPFMREL